MTTLGILLLMQASTEFELTVDGKPWTPYWISPNGTRTPSEGDLLSGPKDCWFPLGQDRSLRLRTSSEEGDGRVFLDRDGRPSTTIGAQVSWTRNDEGGVVFRNPLAKMSDEEVRGLRAVALQFWSPEVLKDLRRLDGSRLAVNLHLMAPIRAKAPFPEMPQGLKYLRVWDGNRHLEEFEALRALHELRVLDLDVSVPFDVRLLADLKKLEWLSLGMLEMTNLDALGGLRALKVLRLDWRENVADLSFAKDLEALEEIQLSQTSVSDLSPLGGLRRLRVIRANGSKVKVLPRGELPALRELAVMSTAVAEEDIMAFAKAHPACHISHRWNTALHAALEDVTRFRIREGGLCHRRGGEKVLFETKDPAIIRKFAALLDVDEEKSGDQCMCCGEPSMEFYRGSELKIEIGFHHGSALRWNGWPGDGRLRPEAADALIRLMAAHGATGPQKAEEAAVEQAKAQERKLQRALAGMTPEVVAAYRKGKDEFKAALEKAMQDPAARAEALLRMLGTSTDSWWTQEWIEQVAEALLTELDEKSLKAVVESALLGTDRVLRRGAGRFWIVGDGAFTKWNPPADSPVRAAVVAALQEARYYPHRQEALRRLESWRDGLRGEVVDARLAAGLRDPEAGVRRQALLTAGKLKHSASAGHLMDILGGKVVEPLPLPSLPAEEERPAGEQPYDTVTALPEAEYAALALGYLGHAPARVLLAAKADLAPTYAVALALLGEPERLSRAHFDGSSRNTELQVAAVEAVVRCKGRTALAEALAYQQTGFWWEREHAARCLREMLLQEGAPGKELLEKAKDLPKLQAWYKAHGAAYVERFKK